MFMNNALNFSLSNAVQIIHVRCGTNYPRVMRQNYPLVARDFVCPRVTRVLVCPRVTSALICPQSEQENQAGDEKPELTEEEIAGT